MRCNIIYIPLISFVSLELSRTCRVCVWRLCVEQTVRAVVIGKLDADGL